MTSTFPSDMNDGSQRRRYVFIDGFRAIAVLLVAAAHLNNALPQKSFFNRIQEITETLLGSGSFFITTILQYLLKPISQLGDTGLDMFFVISGFLISDILLSENDGKINFRRFYCRRVFKIIPSYYCLILAALILYFLSHPFDLRQFGVFAARYLFFLQNYFEQLPGLAHTWSLVVEEQFYAVYPAVLLLIFKSTSLARRRYWLVGTCLFVIGLVCLQRVMYSGSGRTLLNYWLPLQAANIIQTTTYRCDALAFGCLLYILKKYWADVKPLPRMSGWFCIVIAIIGFCFFLQPKGTPLAFVHYYPFDYVSCGLLMSGVYLSGIRWGIENKFLVQVGKCSYNVYLWHFLIVEQVAGWATRMDVLIIVPLYFVVVIAVGMLATYGIERPFLRLRDKLYR